MKHYTEFNTKEGILNYTIEEAVKNANLKGKQIGRFAATLRGATKKIDNENLEAIFTVCERTYKKYLKGVNA